MNDAIQCLLTSTITQTTEKLADLHDSQTTLREELTTLRGKLQYYIDTTQPVNLQPTMDKLSDAGARLTRLNATIQTIKSRLEIINTSYTPYATRHAYPHPQSVENRNPQ